MSEMQAILWRRLDRPGAEAARVIDAPLPTLEGTAVFAEDEPCRLDYVVRCDPSWQTLSATVTGWIGTRAVELAIEADSGRRWTLNGNECAAVHGCVDIDLSFSPVTNLLPIRRLQLKPGARAAARAAWLRFPECRLEPLEQVYERIDRLTYRYESGSGGFRATLKVDSAGLVKSYENLWVADPCTD
jgi:hypothetical protein